MASVIPVILCGKTTQIAVGVIAALKPEMEVVHLCLTADRGKVEIPSILNKVPVTTDVDLGTKDYSKLPRAIIMGGGYTDEDLSILQKSCLDAKTPLVPWLRPDLTKPAPPLGPAYGKALVDRIKVLIAEMEKDKKLEGNNNEVFWY